MRSIGMGGTYKHPIDEIYTDLPFYGSRRITRILQEEGFDIGRDGVHQFMREMGIEAIYPKPNLSKSVPENRIYPYLGHQYHLLQALDSLTAYCLREPKSVWTVGDTLLTTRLRNGFGVLLILS